MLLRWGFRKIFSSTYIALKFAEVFGPQETIDEQFAGFVQELIEDAIKKGATLLTGIKRERNLIYPTLLDHVTEDMAVA